MRAVISFLQNKAGRLVKSPHKFFLLVYIPSSLLISFLLPPFMGPDEATHSYRAYSLSRGDLFLNEYADGMGGFIPNEWIKLNSDQYWDNSNQTLRNAISNNINAYGPVTKPESTVQFYEGTAPYSPIAYIHYLVGFWLGDLFNTNVYMLSIILRLLGAGIFGFMAYLAIKITPRRKWFLVLAALLPMAVHQANVISVDSLVLGSTILGAALLSKVIYSGIKSWKQFGLIVLLAIILALTKQPYIILALSFIALIPNKSFRDANIKLYYKWISVFVICLIFLGWTALSTHSSDKAFDTWRERENTGLTQTAPEWVLNQAQNPIKSLQTLSNTFIFSTGSRDFNPNTSYGEYKSSDNTTPNFIFDTFFGSFGSLKVNYPHWMFILIIVSLFIAFLYEDRVNRKNKIKEKYKINILWLWVVISLQIVLISVALWVKWTPESFNYIAGIQGRYFIPIVFMLILLPNLKFITIKIRRSSFMLFIAVSLFIQVSLMLALIYGRFYTGL